MNLDMQHQLVVEQRLANQRKSTGLTFALWFFFGFLGVHRFYLGHVWRGLAMLACFVVGALTSTIMIGLIPLAFLAIWLLADLFFIPLLVRERNDRERQEIETAMEAMIARTSNRPAPSSPPLAAAGVRCINCGRINPADTTICECGMPMQAPRQNP